MTLPEFNSVDLAKVSPYVSQCNAVIRSQPADFCVDEVLSFEPTGKGSHVWLKVLKQDTNTQWLAKQLAQFSGVTQTAIGYAGLKDRHALTSQWFSINLEGKAEPNWNAFESDNFQILERTRHARKLKIGGLSGNKFRLRLRDTSGPQTLWQQHLRSVADKGVPNYFGEQRFGHQKGNLVKAYHWLSQGVKPKHRNNKSLILSAARAWLFNLVLAERVKRGNWDQYLLGDVMLLAGTKSSLFHPDTEDKVLKARLQRMDIHPTGPLWGLGPLATESESVVLEKTVLEDWLPWCRFLERQQLNQARRSLRLYPQDFHWRWFANDLELSFYLPAGAYATTVLREIALTSQGSSSENA